MRGVAGHDVEPDNKQERSMIYFLVAVAVAVAFFAAGFYIHRWIVAEAAKVDAAAAKAVRDIKTKV